MTILMTIALLLIAINTTLNGIDNRKIKKQIKDIADNQFDAEQVMKLYAIKYSPKPKITTEQKNVVDLLAELDLPIREAEKISGMMIKDQLVRDIAEEIEPYVEVVADKDLHRMEIRYRARLQVINK